MDRRIGELLVERGLIDEARLRRALSEAALWGQRIGEVLVSRGDCSADDVLDALSDQLGVRATRVDEVLSVPAAALDMVPAEEARRRKVLPLAFEPASGALVVAMADPRDPMAISALETMAGRAIEPRLALASQIVATIDRVYFGGARPSTDGPFRRLATPARGIPRPARRTSMSTNPTPPRGMPTQGSMTPARGFQRIDADDHRTPARGFTIEGAPTRARRSVDESMRSQEVRNDEVEALRAEVELLRRQLQRVHDALREANVAHRVLLEQLRDRGRLDVEDYTSAVQIRIERLKAGR